jgi:formylglycine-generating enzyme required for sulfatase activity
MANAGPANAAEMQPYTGTITGTDVTFDLIPIPAGKFAMGSPDAEAGRKPDEGPQREVEIDPFWMGKHEVTWNEFELFMYPDEEKKLRATKSVDPGINMLTDAITHPTQPYVEMSFGMGKDGLPRDFDDAARGKQILPVAEREDRSLLPVTDGGGVGIRRTCRDDDAVVLGR